MADGAIDRFFVSYARTDADVVTALERALATRGIATWIDRSGIRPGNRWSHELAAAIDAGLGVLAVITPSFAASEMCAAEIAHAADGGKLILPLVVDAPTSMPAVLEERQWIDARTDEELERAADAIARITSTEGDRLRNHASVLCAARRWSSSGSDPRELLRGAELDTAWSEVQRHADQEGPPTITPLIRSFLDASAASAAIPSAPPLILGRDDIAPRITDAIERYRLVTITGPGGVGKTTLAIDAARGASRGRFPGGAWFVDLAPLSDPSMVLSTLANEIGVGEVESSALREAVASRIGPRPTLVALDNFEHVLDAAPDISALLAVAPSLHLLVTSRERLEVADEHEINVAPLEPAAAALLLERLLDDRGDGTIDRATASEIAELLDGLPLAIHLAAAALEVMTPSQLAERLRRGEAKLPGRRHAEQRQSSLESLVGWSYDMLDDAERAAFETLSSLPEGCTVDSAFEVADVDLDVLLSLVRRNLLIRRDDRNGEARFRMLATVRAFASERLDEARRDAVLERLAAYLWSGRVGATEETVERLDWFERELGNVRAALAWADRSASVAAFRRLIDETWHLWVDRGHLVEARRYAERLLGHLESFDPPDQASLLAWTGEIAMYAGNLDEAIALRTDAVAIGRRAATPRDLGVMLSDLARTLAHSGRTGDAIATAEEAVAIQAQEPDPTYPAHAAAVLAFTLGCALAPDASHAFEDALRLVGRTGHETLGWRFVQEMETGTEHAAFLLRSGDPAASLRAITGALRSARAAATQNAALTLEVAAVAIASARGVDGSVGRIAAMAAVVRERTGFGLRYPTSLVPPPYEPPDSDGWRVTIESVRPFDVAAMLDEALPIVESAAGTGSSTATTPDPGTELPPHARAD